MSTKNIKSKKLIQLAIYELMLNKDFDEISIKEICEKAGVSRMSFYRYYSCKEDIFIMFCDETFETFFHKISHIPNISTREMLKIFFEGLKKYHREIDILKKARRESLLLVQFEQYTSYLAGKHGDKLPLYNYYKDSHFSIPFFAGGLFNVVMRWSNRNFIDTPDEMTDALMSLLKLEG